jgi:hypothetical protein
MAKVLNDSFGITQGLMTTIHAYTGDQNIHDAPHKDPRRARAAALSIVPTTTGAAQAASWPCPSSRASSSGMALRVPIPDGSITDLTLILDREVTKDEINAAMKEAAEGPLKGILQYSEEPLVSIDIVGNPHSCIFDAPSTLANGRLVKVLGWYDNEMGYSTRLAEATVYLGRPAVSSPLLDGVPTLGDLDAAGKRVFVRADLNVPLRDGRSPTTCGCGRRSRPSPAARPGCGGVVASHLGRPKGAPGPGVLDGAGGERLAELLGVR